MKHLLICLFLFLLSFGPTAHALEGEWQQLDQAALRLIASNKVDESGALYVGLDVTLKDGWDTYWRSPGDAGFPPAPDWKGSINLASATLLFPWPSRYTMQGFETYGYKDGIVFPVKIDRQNVAEGMVLHMAVTLLTCADICLPADFKADLTIPADFVASPDDDATRRLKEALAKVPALDNGTGFSLRSASLEGRRLTLSYSAPETINLADIIIEVGDGSTLPLKDVRVVPDTITASFTENAALAEIAGKELTFTVIDNTNHRAVEKKMALTGAVPSAVPRPSVSSAPPTPASLWLMLAIAVLGGLILNLMPCVLPVLALKSLAFISHGGGTPSGVRLSFLATSGGILFSFLIMAAALIGLKELGMSVGWGVQFQHPAFLTVLILLLLVFSLNLFGLFEIPLPRFLADRLSWTHGHGNLAKDFLSGAFATLLATPCTAPFLGTAVGFALAGGAVEILAIFTALGTGLALPFLLIAAFPKTATWLPKPGAWMNKVKYAMGGLLLLTALWLGSVLVMQLSAAPPKAEAAWRVFDEEKIAPLVAEGKIVLVDVTADWCLTCQVNKRFVLDDAAMKIVLQNSGIVLMKADWTKPDERIGSYLRSFGRYGIPFNVVYGPKAPQGIPLPELLNKEAVLKGFTDAGLASVQ